MAISAAEKQLALGAADAAIELPVGGFGTVSFQIASDPAFTGTITFEATVDHGTWQTLNVTKTNSSSQVTSATAPGVWVGSCAGLKVVRARMSAYTNGTALVTMLAAGTGGGGGAGGGGGGGGAVTIADGDDVAEGATTDAAVDTDTTGTVSGKLRGLVKLWVNYLTRFPASLGQKAMAASLPVVIASDQSAIPVTGTVTATNASVGVVGVAAPASATEVGFVDGAGDLAAEAGDNLDFDTGGGSQAVTVKGVALPGPGGPVAWTGGAGAVSEQVGRITLASDDPAVAVLGATTGAAVITDANGTIQQYLRGLIKLAITTGGWLTNITQWGSNAVTGGAGNVAAGTPRVTLAADDPAVASLAILDNIVSGNEAQVDVLTLPSQTSQANYTASATITISPANVASSATFIAGVESDAISNISNLYDDVLVSGKWTAGTSPTAGTVVNVYVYAPISDDLASTVVWPDVLDGTASAETFTSAGILAVSVKLGATLQVDATTSDRTYWCAPFSVAKLFGGRMPSRWGLFISHNTAVNSNSTAGNHAWFYVGLKQRYV